MNSEYVTIELEDINEDLITETSFNELLLNCSREIGDELLALAEEGW